MFYLALVSLIWAFSFGIIGSTLRGVDPFFLATARLSIAFLFFLPFLRRKKLAGSESRRLVLLGSIQFGVMYVSYIKAFEHLPSHLVALFSVLTPVYVVLTHSLRQKIWSNRYIIAAALSVAGAFVIRATNESDGSILIGFLLMQIAGIAFAYGQVAYRDWKLKHPEIKDHECFALLYGGGVLCALLFSLFLTDWSAIAVSGKQTLAILYLGIVASGCGFFFWNKGASLSSAGTLAAFNNAVVPLAVFCSLFIFGEIKDVSLDSGIRLLIGAVLISGAVWIGRKREDELPVAKS